MAIIYTYPQINSSSDLAASDLMIISDMSANGRPTKSLTLKNLADFITTTGTGTGTTNAIIKWTDGPSGLLGDSIMNEDVDKINLNGILRIADNNDNRLEVKYGTDSSTTHLNNAPASNHIIGRAGDLFIKNRARTRDILFQADDGQYDGNVTTYFRLDGSMADVGTPSYYTRWGNNSHIVLGNSANTNNLDFNMYHDGSDTYLINGSSFLYVESKGGVSIENKSGGSGDIDIIQSVTNADVNISAYNGNYLRVDTSAGATIFSKPVQVPLVPTVNANAASKQYVDQQIASIPAGLVFQGNWDASTNTPTLASGTGTVGNYYVVSVAGNTNLDGITDWEVGDWAVFVEVGGVDKWDKIDQTFVQGAGATGQVSFWSGINSVTGDNDLYWDNSNKRLGIGTTSPAEKLEVAGNIGINQYILHNNDLNTFFGFPGNDTVSIGTNGTERMRINSSGYVGIGTTSPGFTLDVVTSDYRAAEFTRPAGTNCYIVLKDQNTTNDVGIGATTNNLKFRSGNSDNMILTSTGNLGIGTISPAYKLTVEENAATDAVRILNTDSNGGGLSVYAANGGGGTNRILTLGDSALNIKVAVVENGNVGIGTTSPSEKLQVTSSSNPSIKIQDTTNGFAQKNTLFFNQNIVAGQTDVAKIYTELTNGATASLDNPLKFATAQRSTLTMTDRMVIDNLGNIGVGTTSPAAKLDVNAGTENLVAEFESTDSIAEIRIKDSTAYSRLLNVGTQLKLMPNDGVEMMILDGNDNTVNIPDSKKITFGNSDDLEINHDGTTSNISNNTGNLSIINHFNDGDIKFFSDDGAGGVTEYFRLDGGDARTIVSREFRFLDGVASKYGNSGDLEVYHDGTNARIQNYTGALKIINNTDDGDIEFFCDNGGGGITEYFKLDGANKRTKFSEDILIVDGKILRLGSGGDVAMFHTGTHSFITNATGDLTIANYADDRSIYFQSDDGSGGATNYMQIDGANEVNKFYKHAQFLDSIEAKFGNGGDLRIYHDGTNSRIYNDTGDLYIRNSADDKDIYFQSDNGSGGVATYLKLWGAIESLAVYKDMLFVNDGNGGKLKFGASQDLQIYHDGSNSYIQDASGTGDIRIASNIVHLNNAASTEVMLKAIENGAVELYYNDNKKLETTSTGTKTTGQMDLAALNTAVTNSDDNGNVGEIRFTADYIYVCVADDTWKRVALSTW